MKRYAVCGVSNRAISMFIRPIVNQFSEMAEVVALLDSDAKRYEVCKQQFSQLESLPEYAPDDFDRMIKETKPDVIIVT